MNIDRKNLCKFLMFFNKVHLIISRILNRIKKCIRVEFIHKHVFKMFLFYFTIKLGN